MGGGALKWQRAQRVPFQGPKSLDFSLSGLTPYNGPIMDIARLKIITYCALKTTGTVIVISYPDHYLLLFCEGKTENNGKSLVSLRMTTLP
jgi:hypothetical protein